MRSASVIAVPAVLLLAGVVLHDGTAQPSKTQITRRYTPADRESGRYQYVPFDVPPRTRSLRIAYQYDRANAENVVDLGLFEPGLLDLGTPAFRGYSGGARTAIELSIESATPGYRPGPLPPGRWHLLLGLYRVGKAGVDVTIDIETAPAAPTPVHLSAAPAHLSTALAHPPTAPVAPDAPVHRTAPHAPDAPSAPDAPASAVAPRWFMGALHTHTLHSDGTTTPVELLERTRALGFDFVAITDHNNVTHRGDLARLAHSGDTPLWIAGEEVTTPSGHASVWGLDDGEWVDFRVRAEDRKIGDLIAAAHRFGALFSINHPASECVGCGWEHEVPSEVDAIEVSNGRHGEVSRALSIWDDLLQRGRRVTAVGSSDWHAAPNPIDVANARVRATALTEAAILAAIRAGHVIIVNGARHPTPEVVVRSGARSAGAGDTLEIDRSTSRVAAEIRAESLPDGTVVAVVNGTRETPVTLDAHGAARIERRASPGYIRFELSAAEGTLIALTNPVYLVAR